MKTIMLLLLSSCCFARQDSILLGASIKANNYGVYVAPQIEINCPFNESFELNGRAGLAMAIYQDNYFYIQNGLRYKTKSAYIGIYPTWLRRYDKSIGYQTPSSVVIGYKAPFNIDVEFWADYWYQSVTSNVVIMWRIGKVYH